MSQLSWCWGIASFLSPSRPQGTSAALKRVVSDCASIHEDSTTHLFHRIFAVLLKRHALLFRSKGVQFHLYTWSTPDTDYVSRTDLFASIVSEGQNCLGPMNPPSITEASYRCTVRQHVIRICRNLPDGIHATRGPCENRKRVSVRRAIPGRLKRPCSFLCKHGKYRLLRMSVTLSSYNL